MKRILKIDTYHELLAHNGYFTFPMLTELQVEEVRKIALEEAGLKFESFYSSSFDADEQRKHKINSSLNEFLLSSIENLFSDYKVLGYNFLVKKAGSDYALPIHQDWTVTDEKEYGSYTIWIPLDAVDKRNGALRIIPGSHLFDENHRAPSLPVAFESIRNYLETMLKTISLNAGEAFVFNQKLMHASWPNSSDSHRLALTIGVAHKDAQLMMLYKNTNGIDIYKMPDDMFINYSKIIDKPEMGEYDSTIENGIKVISKKEISHRVSDYNLNSRRMKPLFNSAELQSQFEQKGYVKLPGLNEHAVAELKNYFEKSGLKNEGSYGFYVGMDNPNKTLVIEMVKTIKEIASPFITPYIDSYQIFTASFVNKDSDPKGIVPPHQDWSFVEDEVQHCSVTCWIPLQDVDMFNGCIGVVKGSNKFFDHVRPSPSPQTPSPLSKHMFSIFPMISLLDMKAGEILIFDNKTIHASPPNVSNQTRLAVGLGFTQKDAKIRHHYLKPGTKDRILTYEVDESFFTKYDNGTLSTMYNQGKLIEGYRLLEEQPFTVENWSSNLFMQRMKEAGNIKNEELTNFLIKNFKDQMKTSFFQKMASFFKIH